MRLHEMSISAIQHALGAGELSAREIARQTLEAIARVNPQIGAWTAVTEARMLAEAESIDTLRRDAAWAISDILGRSRSTVELI